MLVGPRHRRHSRRKNTCELNMQNDDPAMAGFGNTSLPHQARSRFSVLQLQLKLQRHVILPQGRGNPKAIPHLHRSFFQVGIPDSGKKYECSPIGWGKNRTGLHAEAIRNGGSYYTSLRWHTFRAGAEGYRAPFRRKNPPARGKAAVRASAALGGIPRGAEQWGTPSRPRTSTSKRLGR